MPPDHTRLLEDQAHLLRSLLQGPALRRVMGPMRGSMDVGRRLGCRGGASPTGASWSPTPPARPNERGRHTAALPPQPSTRGSADPGGATPDVRHPASGSAEPLGTHVVGPPGRFYPSAGKRTGPGVPSRGLGHPGKATTSLAAPALSEGHLLLLLLTGGPSCSRTLDVADLLTLGALDVLAGPGDPRMLDGGR
ncbi:hypothetical protein MRX96_018197 [Rhipicephalus microplus]